MNSAHLARLKRKREYRKQDVEAFKYLKQRVLELTAELSQLKQKKSTLLPWSDVALALQEELTQAEECNASLRRRRNCQEELIRRMEAWITSMSSPQRTPREQLLCMHTSLPSEEHARHLALQWISQRLFNCLGAFVSQTNLVHGAECLPWLTAEVYGEALIVRGSAQHIVHNDIASVVPAVHEYIFEGPRHRQRAVLHKEQDLLYQRYVIESQSHVNEGFFENLLVLRYACAERVVYITHTISNDENHPEDKFQRELTGWHIVEKIDANTTIIKEGFTRFNMGEDYAHFDTESSHQQCRQVEETMRRALTASYMSYLAQIHSNLPSSECF